MDFDPPKNEGICDQDGSRLIQRDDDKPETVQAPVRVPRADQAADRLVRGRGPAAPFDGNRSPEEVHRHIRATLATLKLEAEL